MKKAPSDQLCGEEPSHLKGKLSKITELNGADVFQVPQYLKMTKTLHVTANDSFLWI